MQSKYFHLYFEWNIQRIFGKVAQYVQMPKGTPKHKFPNFGPKTQLSQKWEFLSLNTGRSRRRPLGPSGLTASPAAPSPRSAPSPVRLRPPQRATGPLPPPLAPVRSSPTAQSRVPTSPSRRGALCPLQRPPRPSRPPRSRRPISLPTRDRYACRHARIHPTSGSQPVIINSFTESYFAPAPP